MTTRVKSQSNASDTQLQTGAERWNRKARLWWLYLALAFLTGAGITLLGGMNMFFYIFLLLGPFTTAVVAGFLLNDRLRFLRMRPSKMFFRSFADVIRREDPTAHWPHS
jgi:hypothetical protein